MQLLENLFDIFYVNQVLLQLKCRGRGLPNKAKSYTFKNMNFITGDTCIRSLYAKILCLSWQQPAWWSVLANVNALGPTQKWALYAEMYFCVSLCHIWRVVCQKQVSRTWTSINIPQIQWDVITYPCHPWSLSTFNDTAEIHIKTWSLPRSSIIICFMVHSYWNHYHAVLLFLTPALIYL